MDSWYVSGCVSGTSGFVVIRDRDDEESVYIPLEEVDKLITQLQQMRQQVYDKL